MSSSGASYRVLVVCTGNICRSPMGERLLRHGLADAAAEAAGLIEVTSAGTYFGHAGDPMQPGAAAVMAERGIEHLDFRATAISETLIESNDLILTAERAHRSDVVRLSPLAVHRTFTLREFGRLVRVVNGSSGSSESDPASPGTFGDLPTLLADLVVRAALARGSTPIPLDDDDDLADPYAMPISEFRRCADRIDQGLAPVLDALARRS